MRILKLILFLGVLLTSVPMLFAQSGNGIEAVREAANKNKHLFIFFYKKLDDKALHAQKKFDQTMEKLGGQADFIKIKADDPSQKAIIEQFDLKRSPMPFVLVLAPNGAITGGFPSNFTEQQLINSISTPGMASCLKALQDRKLVFLCLQNNQTLNNEEALKGVRNFKADSRFTDATEIIFINPSDTQEANFLNQLSLDIHSPQALTVLISPPAEIIGNYSGATSKDQILSDLENATSGCCGPGGCCPGGSCSPKK